MKELLKKNSSIFPFLSFLFFACSRTQPAGGEQPVFTVTVSPYAHMLYQLAGENAEILDLSEGQEDAHEITLSPRQSVLLQKSRLYFHLDPVEEARILTILPEHTTVVPFWRNIQLIPAVPHPEHGEGHEEEHEEEQMSQWDTHFWLSPRELELQIGQAAEVLVRQLPDHRDEILKNAETLSDEIKQLGREMQLQLSHLRGGKILSSHPMFRYLGRFLGFSELSLEEGGFETSQAHLASIYREIPQLTVPAIFTRAQDKQDHLAAFARQNQLQIIEFNPIATDYTANLRKLLSVLRANKE